MNELNDMLSCDRIAAWQTARKLLCVRLDNMGDVLMTTPALRALRRASPERTLTLLASDSGAAVARHIPEIDAVMCYRAPWIKASSEHPASVDRDMLEQLVRARFDAAIIFTCYSQSPLPAALLCSQAGIPLKLAYCRENPYALLSDWLPEREPEHGVRHEVQRQIDLVAAIGASCSDTRLSFRVHQSDRASMRAKLAAVPALQDRASEIAAGSYLVLHPGATASSRRYAPERFAAVAGSLLCELNVPILITGGPDERALADRIARSAGRGAINVAGLLSLGELAALIERALLLISNNTGPVHIAAALGRPVVDLYALTNPQHTPWNVCCERSHG